jgi:hypothetical protein
MHFALFARVVQLWRPCFAAFGHTCKTLMHAGDKWYYNPSSAPTVRVDPAHVLQVQLQMQATGARVGWIVSFARQGIRIFEAKFDEKLVRSVARVLKSVLQGYIDPEACPAFPRSITNFDAGLQKRWVKMQQRLSTAVSAVGAGFVPEGACWVCASLLWRTQLLMLRLTSTCHSCHKLASQRLHMTSGHWCYRVRAPRRACEALDVVRGRDERA